MFSGWQVIHPVASRPTPAPDPTAAPDPATVTAAGPALGDALGHAPSLGGEGGRGPVAEGAALDRRGWSGVLVVRCSPRRR
jgi:hypothetical protein